jgi:hypothetical protein
MGSDGGVCIQFLLIGNTVDNEIKRGEYLTMPMSKSEAKSLAKKIIDHGNKHHLPMKKKKKKAK